MSAMDCVIVGTGDGKLNSGNKTAGSASKTIAKDIVFEIVDNALDMVDMERVSLEQFKEKSGTPLIGTGDQKSSDSFTVQEPIICHPPVEKKNRLTDLVKNSKQVLAKIMMSDSKLKLQEEKKDDEQLVEVIELDCVQASDLPFKSSSRTVPEEVPLPDEDEPDTVAPFEEFMEEIGLNTAKDENQPAAARRRMTFPRASGSRAKAAFVARCRTLKREATNLKKKKWDVRGRIANLFRRKPTVIDDFPDIGKSWAKQEMEQVVETEEE